MVAITSVSTRAIDRARETPGGVASDQVVRSGPLQQSIVALVEGARLAPHQSDVPASLYLLAGAVRIEAEEPFVLQRGDLHQMPSQRRGVTALADTVLLLTAVTKVSDPDSPEGLIEDHTLPLA